MVADGGITSHRRPEGETTQWEDLQRKFGNLPPAAPVERPKPFEPKQEPDRVRDLVETENVDDLEQMEDDFADDPFLQQYRELRMKQLQESGKRGVYSGVRKITRDEFVSEVNEASTDVWVILHLYKDKVAASALLASCLEQLAAKFRRTKFLKIISNECIPDYPDRNLPTLLAYKDKQCKHNLVGMLPFGGRITPDGVAEALNRLGPICQQ